MPPGAPRARARGAARAPARSRTASRRGQQLVERGAARLLVEEGLVRRVLEQAPDQVGHAGHELADGAVGAHAQAARGECAAEVVAQAAQELQLEVAVLA